jgi:hypothetical protein
LFGDAAAGIERIVAVAAEEQRRHGETAVQLDGVVCTVAVHEQMAEGRPVGGV